MEYLSMIEKHTLTPSFAPLVVACKAHGISRTVAFALCKAGLLENFRIGKRRYCYLESLRTLPERLAKLEESK